MTSPIVHRPTVSRICAGCDGPMVVTFDAVGRASKKGPQCPRCDRVSIAQQGSIPELRGWSQQESAPPVPPLTLPKHRSAFAVLPTVHPFVEVPARPDPLPSRYVKSEAETHPKDLPADHPRRITYRAKLSATQKAARARKREEREAREALVRPAESLPARTKTERKYQPKPCAFLPCGKLFTPTGPMIERRSDLRALPARPAHHAPVRGDLTPLSAIIPAVMDDLLERCETYRATHRESA